MILAKFLKIAMLHVVLEWQKIYKCSGQKMPDSSKDRLSEALGNLGSGNLEGGGFGERVG